MAINAKYPATRLYQPLPGSTPIAEARDLGEMNRYKFYEHMKVYTASPPDVLRVDEKNLREYYVFNCCGIVITTNHKTDGIYLPANDRRHYVAWSDLAMGDFSEKYWIELWGWYDAGGDRHVAAYLAEYDLSAWDAKAPPPKTAAFWDIVDANRAPEESELADALDTLANPKAVALSQVVAADRNHLDSNLAEWLCERSNRRTIPYRFAAVGYTPVRNDTAPEDGLWKLYGKRQAIYAKVELSISDRLAAARDLVRKAAEEAAAAAAKARR